jgi:hypothetical protein
MVAITKKKENLLIVHCFVIVSQNEHKFELQQHKNE